MWVGLIIMKKQNKKEIKKNQITIKSKYVKPELLSLGDIRDVTMGGSFGATDSGVSGVEKTPGT